MGRNLQTVAQFANGTPFTEGQIRWWIFNSANNGMDDAGVILRVGRRVYLDPDRFFGVWVARQNREGAA
ncbi:DNA-binding protein [Salinisphaera orenii]|uniref:DNA-binding protein n=1 Tax=Salinisphaera orenii TaxID=856731 RepID=UPI000F4A9C69|nr:DNA-binding protein [Salinisphaera halophila]